MKSRLNQFRSETKCCSFLFCPCGIRCFFYSARGSLRVFICATAVIVMLVVSACAVVCNRLPVGLYRFKIPPNNTRRGVITFRENLRPDDRRPQPIASTIKISYYSCCSSAHISDLSSPGTGRIFDFVNTKPILPARRPNIKKRGFFFLC